MPEYEDFNDFEGQDYNDDVERAMNIAKQQGVDVSDLDDMFGSDIDDPEYGEPKFAGGVDPSKMSGKSKPILPMGKAGQTRQFQKQFDDPVDNQQIEYGRHKGKRWGDIDDFEKTNLYNQLARETILRKNKRFKPDNKKLQWLNLYSGYFKKNPDRFRDKGEIQDSGLNRYDVISTKVGDRQSFKFDGDERLLYVPEKLKVGDIINQSHWNKYAPNVIKPEMLNLALIKAPSNIIRQNKKFFTAVRDYLAQNNYLASYNKADKMPADKMPSRDVTRLERRKKFWKSLASFENQPIDSIDDHTLGRVLKLFLGTYKNSYPKLYEKYADLLNNIKNKLQGSNEVFVVGDRATDVLLDEEEKEFYLKYKGSEWIGSEGEQLSGLELVYLDMTTRPKLTKGKRAYNKVLFKQKGTNNIVEYWDWWQNRGGRSEKMHVKSQKTSKEGESMGGKDPIKFFSEEKLKYDKVFVVDAEVEGNGVFEGVKRTYINIETLHDVERVKNKGTTTSINKALNAAKDILDVLNQQKLPIPTQLVNQKTGKLHQIYHKLKPVFHDIFKDLVYNKGVLPRFSRIRDEFRMKDDNLSSYFANDKDAADILRFMAKREFPELLGQLEGKVKEGKTDTIKRTNNLIDFYGNPKNYEQPSGDSKLKAPKVLTKDFAGRQLSQLRNIVDQFGDQFSEEFRSGLDKAMNALQFYADAYKAGDKEKLLKDKGNVARKANIGDLAAEFERLGIGDELEKSDVGKVTKEKEPVDTGKVQSKFEKLKQKEKEKSEKKPEPQGMSKFEKFKQQMKEEKEAGKEVLPEHLQRILKISNYKRVI